jgi:glycosyltransferase involved in cell wall biosynthesis
MEVYRALSSPIVFALVYNTTYLAFFDHARVVYEHIDELDVFPGEPETLKRVHDEMIRSADLVVATADKLYEDIHTVRQDVILCPNAVDNVFIRRILDSTSEPPEELRDLVAQKKIIIGYYGALAKWFDYELLEQAAVNRPEYEFILIGPDYDGSILTSGIMDKTNIQWLGTKPYIELPSYLKYFDVAIIPFKLNEITHSTSPLKLFEYMAAGKPVVTTAMHECKRYSEVLIAHDEAEFAVKLDEALKLCHNENYLQALEHVAQQNTWVMRAEAILSALGSADARNL